MDELTAAVMSDGQSSEHIVSRVPTANIIEHIDRVRYNVLLVGIIEERHWIKADSLDDVKTGVWGGGTMTALFPPDVTRKCVILTGGDRIEEVKLDVVFPVLRRLCGEDGTIRRFLGLARTPYIGCGVLASTVPIDKLYTKIIVSNLGIRQTEYEVAYREELSAMDRVAERIEKHFLYPVFIKPSSIDSFRGISKTDNRRKLMDRLTEAAYHDREILVGETIMGRETECAVFGGSTSAVEAPGVGEILAAAEFYDFDARYSNEDSHTVTDPELPNGAIQHVYRAAIDIFRAVDGYSLVRMDFFVKDDGEVAFSEINAVPGFTVVSTYPMLWEARGISKDRLAEKLLSYGMERYV